MSFQTVNIGPCMLICGDMAEVLLNYRSVFDLVCTDAPYALTSGGRGEPGDGSMSGIFDAEDYDNSGNLMEIMRWNLMGPPIYRACKSSADCYVMANDKNLFLAYGAMQGAGFKLHNILPWDKHSPTPNRWYMKHLEFTLYLWKGKSRMINNPGSKQLFRTPAPRGEGKIHPTQKPIALMAEYIGNSTKAGDTVLDPFMGSASTLIAAAQLGRRAVGIEVDQERFDAACVRVEAAVRMLGKSA